MNTLNAKQKKQLLILLVIIVGTAATIFLVKTVQDLRSKAFSANKAFYMTDENGNELEQTGNDEQNNVFKYKRTSNTVRMNIKDLTQ